MIILLSIILILQVLILGLLIAITNFFVREYLSEDLPLNISKDENELPPRPSYADMNVLNPPNHDGVRPRDPNWDGLRVIDVP